MSNIRGKLVENAPIGQQSWFRCGGNADLLFKPADIEDLAEFLKQSSPETPITVIGGLANTIIRDGGIRGATIQLGKEFSDIALLPSSATQKDAVIKSQYDNILMKAGAGALNGNVAAFAVKNGIGGFEFLSGIPGSLGGALRMNAGAYGSDISDILVAIEAVDFAGNRYLLSPSSPLQGLSSQAMDHRGKPCDDAIVDERKINLSYRNNDAPDNLIFTSAILKGVAEDYDSVKSRITEIKKKRNETQPIREQTGGSTFANPDPGKLKEAGLPEDMRAWQVVEKVGGRSLKIGGAQMSEKHCNFMINTGNATAADLENLGDEIKNRAYQDLGLEMHWEIKRIGEQ